MDKWDAIRRDALEEGHGLSLPAAGIDLLLGPPNAGKLGEIVAWAAAHRPRSPVLVVPSRADVTSLTAELVGRLGAIVGSRPVMTMDELAEDIVGERRAAAGDLEQLILVKHLLAELKLEAVGEVAGFPGTAAAVLGVFRELADSGYETAEIGSLLAAGANRESGSIAGDMGRIWDAYQAHLAEVGLVDRTDSLRAAVSAIPGWSRPVGFYGFLSFTSGQRSLLAELAGHVPVLIALSYEKGRLGAHGLDAEVAWWQERAIRVRTLPPQDGVFEAPDLAALERGFMRGSVDSAGSASASRTGEDWLGEETGVRFLLAASRQGEAEQVAREILRLLGEGYAPDDIAVLVRRLGPWRRTLGHALRACGVPHRMDARVRLAQTGLGQSLTSALTALTTREVEPLISYLRGPYCSVPIEQVDAFEIDRAAEIRASGEACMQLLKETFPGSVDRLETAFGKKGSGELGLDPGNLQQLAWEMVVSGTRGEDGTGALNEEDLQAYSVVVKSCDQLSRISTAGWDGELLSAEDTLELMGNLPVWLGRGDERGVVRIMSVARARARRFPVVFMMGLVDGEFPLRQSPPVLLDEGERRGLNLRAGADLLPEARTGEDVALFHHALSRPLNLLYLSARDSGDSGEEAVLSPFWKEARATLGGARIWRSRGLDQVVDTPDRALTRREYLRGCVLHGEEPPAEEDRDLLNTKVGMFRAVAPKESAAVRAAISRRTTFSAGELETYHQCPFRWFVERGLRVQDMDPLSMPLVRGSLLHAVLEQVYGHLIETGSFPLDGSGRMAAEEEVSRALHHHLGRMGLAMGAGQRRLLEREVRRMVGGLLDRETANASDFTPAATEHSLPEDGVKVAEGIRLRGRIDRIDLSQTGEEAFVVDYKTGRPTRQKKLAEAGSLQLILYVLALRGERPEVNTVGGAYLHLRFGEVRGLAPHDLLGGLSPGLSGLKGRGEDEVEAEIEQGLEAAKKAVDGMKAGRIAAEPLGECPRFCDWGPLCRSKRGA